MRVAVVGYGSIGRRHVDNLFAHIGIRDGIDVYDPVTPMSLPFGVDHRSSPFGYGVDYRKPDVALICSPARMHAEHLRVCMRERVPFLLEKPAVLAENELTNDEWMTDVPHVVGYNMIFRSEVSNVFDAVRDAPVGPKSVKWWCHADMGTWPGSDYGDPVSEFSHEVDLSLRCGGQAFISGPPVVTWPDATRTVSVRLTWIGGELVPVAVDLAWGDGRAYARGCDVSWADGRKTGYEWNVVPWDVNETYVSELWHFVAVAFGRERSRSTLAQARDVVRYCEAVNARRPS